MGLLHLGDGVFDGTRRYDGLAAWASMNPGRACALWLSCGLTHEYVVPQAAGIGSDARALDWARAQCLHYHGESARDWALAPWHEKGIRGVSALHGVSLADLLRQARDARLRLTRVSPWWSAVLARSTRRHPTLRRSHRQLIVIERHSAVQLRLQDDRLVGVRVRSLDAGSPVGLEAVIDGSADPAIVVGYGWPGALPPGFEAADGATSLGRDGPATPWLSPA